MVECQVGQRFAVEANAFLAERMDEAAVAHAFHAGSGVNTRDPQAAIDAFFVFPVAKSVLPAFFKGVFSDGVNFGTGAKIAAGGFHDFFPAGAAGRIVGCSWHV